MAFSYVTVNSNEVKVDFSAIILTKSHLEIVFKQYFLPLRTR